ncbi:hypothetical protein LWI28_000007 [Acer negundo]|uniref:Uncharacterized protein n=1 Tax=Acer negundo TaxID=4023 RepID=A0AAD5JRN7_ACENE|nr:hypothetical protein LWI28_000007 [Acer negundo]
MIKSRKERREERERSLSPPIAVGRRRCRSPPCGTSVAVAAERYRKRRDRVATIHHRLAPLSLSLPFTIGSPLLSRRCRCRRIHVLLFLIFSVYCSC